MNYKSDMVAIKNKINSKIELDKRVIIEVINDNTFIVDRPFEVHKDLATDYIFDFKFLILPNKPNDILSLT